MKRLGSNTAIKSWLLTQRPVAGVGNIYADEPVAGRYRPISSGEELRA